MSGRSIVTTPNVLTLARLLLAPACALCMVSQRWTVAAALFTLAALSDYFDGRIARANAQASAAGALFDHATDAFFVCVTLAAAAFQNAVASAIVVLIPAAFVQYVFDSRVLQGRPLRGDWLGRWNGIAYFVLAGAAIATGLLRDTLHWPGTALADAVYVLSLLLCLTTLGSMLNRGVHWWHKRRTQQS